LQGFILCLKDWVLCNMRKYLFFGKKGELTTQQIVLLIILIVSFIVILFLLFRLNLGKTSDSEVCHNSVVMRGSSVIPTDSVTLNCKTQYVCITNDGTCEGLVKPEKIKVESVNDVYSELSSLMADCFWMFGERKVDYIGGKALHNNYCSICSQIYFDDSLKNIKEIENGNISKDELYNYMAHTKVPNKDYSYLQYMAGTNDIASLKKASLDAAKLQGEGTFGNIEVGKQYFVVTGITSKIGKEWIIVGVAGAALGVVVGFSPIGWVAGAVIIGGSVLAGVSGESVANLMEPEIVALTVKGDGIENKFMLPTIVEVDSDKFKSLSCEDVLTFS
jgi:hypothetical protein